MLLLSAMLLDIIVLKESWVLMLQLVCAGKFVTKEHVKKKLLKHVKHFNLSLLYFNCMWTVCSLLYLIKVQTNTPKYRYRFEKVYKS